LIKDHLKKIDLHREQKEALPYQLLIF